jgi:hypothetical protein
MNEFDSNALISACSYELRDGIQCRWVPYGERISGARRMRSSGDEGSGRDCRTGETDVATPVTRAASICDDQ